MTTASTPRSALLTGDTTGWMQVDSGVFDQQPAIANQGLDRRSKLCDSSLGLPNTEVDELIPTNPSDCILPISPPHRRLKIAALSPADVNMLVVSQYSPPL
ncbi:hypothetical protein HYQ46_008151 [Verticillium longisporum]|nr:hypothetical protein HYQ46_008151 [Verticillium longisporum]